MVTVRCIDALEASHFSAVSDLSRRVANLESAPADPQPLAATARIATLEVNYANRDAEFTKRLADLKALRHVTYGDSGGCSGELRRVAFGSGMAARRCPYLGAEAGEGPCA
jgi:hypothetical protein